jgi:dTDP-3-amino-3,4,6-trideoxy-alpha-D-glucose transaminase
MLFGVNQACGVNSRFMTATPSIPFNDLRTAYLALREEIDAAVAEALDSGWYILGRQTTAFEEEFAAYTHTAGCVGVNSGTDALTLALRACEIGPGDEVITVAHTAVATVAAIRLAGATPVLVDVDPQTYTMDPQALEAAVTPATRAVIPVHIYGQAADLTAIQASARRHGVFLIEDCA